MHVCTRMGVYLYLLYSKYHYTYSNSKLNAFLQNGANVAGPDTFKCVYDGKFGLRLLRS